MSLLLTLGIKAVLVGGSLAVMGVGGAAVALISAGGSGSAVGITSTVGLFLEPSAPESSPAPTPEPALGPAPEPGAEPASGEAPLVEPSVAPPALQLSLAQPADVADPDILTVGKEIQILGTNPNATELTVIDAAELTPAVGLPDGCPEGSFAVRDVTSYDAVVAGGASVVVGAFTLQFEKFAENQDACMGGTITFTWS